MKKDYAKLIINNLIKQRESLFISASTSQQSFVDMLLEEANNKKIKDIFVNYYDISSNYKYWKEYIEKDASFLFVFDENDYDNMTSKICSGFMANEIDAAYLVVPTYEVLKSIDTDFIVPKSNIDLNILLSDNKRIASKLKNLKINRIMIKSLFDTDLKMRFNGDIRNITDRSNMTCFPFWGTEIRPVEASTSGIVEASSYVIVDGIRIQGFRGYIKNDELVEYDCDNYHKEAKKIFDRNNDFRFSSFNLPYYKNIDINDNLALTKLNPYITLKDNNDRQLNIPIAAKSLSIDAITDMGKIITLYNENEMDKKILIRK